MIIDATDLIMGRIATKAAKSALMGEKVDIVNCESAVISGGKENILAKYKRFRDMGNPKFGPYMPRMPDRFLRRAIKRMLPYKQPKGKEAFKRIMCYIGVPDEFKDKKLDTVKEANMSKLPNVKYVTLKDVCKFMGAKI